MTHMPQLKEDKILEILKGRARKRVKKRLDVFIDTAGGMYTIQYGGRTIDSGAGGVETARAAAEARADKIEALNNGDRPEIAYL